MERLGCVNAHLKSTRHQVFIHLQNTLFDLSAIVGFENILLEILLVNLVRLFLISSKKECLIMTQEKTIYIDSNQNFNLWDISQLTTKLEVTRGAEETRHCPETSEGSHLGGNPLKLMK